jgi:hypothetical protein
MATEDWLPGGGGVRESPGVVGEVMVGVWKKEGAGVSGGLGSLYSEF